MIMWGSSPASSHHNRTPPLATYLDRQPCKLLQGTLQQRPGLVACTCLVMDVLALTLVASNRHVAELG